MPVFNEVNTAKAAIERVLNKTIPDVLIELIIVESNSTDGTSELVMEYKDNPRVCLIFQSQPRGKGNAVREGLIASSGDIILIQDADDEYDIDDYDKLILPLRDGVVDFVLGSRHSESSWQMRQFSDQPFKAFILNCGHWFFTFLVNILYGVWLRDPFTMYKVFNAKCISGMDFVCNRFDFDYELLIKLIRRGYKPLEIPVNYNSRSFADGKKVTMFGDPLTWLVALVRFRFSKKP
jgi:glycosyltransferase involved in cell wall biosynthesis